MITVSDKAAEKLDEELIQRCLDAGLGFRVVNDNHEPGHTVFSIKLDKECPGDEVVTSHGIRIFLGPADAALLENCELDYLDEPTGGFCLKNEVATGATQVTGSEGV